ncbi:hypothetical protein B0H12DRAFT_1204207 [Mycena haematopus]|nr:hypothetical protein B0H12DRAFT_1204207 [Mycena haematopus]
MDILTSLNGFGVVKQLLGKKQPYKVILGARDHSMAILQLELSNLKGVKRFLQQHYLVHLFRDKLVASGSRIVFVSSGGIYRVKDPRARTFETDLKDGSGSTGFVVYPASKLAGLFAAHWWRRQPTVQCTVTAVSSGLIPKTGLTKGLPAFTLPPEMIKNAKSVPEGAASILAAFVRADFPDEVHYVSLA